MDLSPDPSFVGPIQWTWAQAQELRPNFLNSGPIPIPKQICLGGQAASAAFWCGTGTSFWTYVEDPHQGQKLVGPFDISVCETG